MKAADGYTKYCTLNGLRICFLTILLLGVYMLHSCKKEDDAPVIQYSCKITEPEDGNRFQASGGILFKAELQGFGDSASVHFSAANFIDTVITEAPYRFTWTSPAMLTDTLTIRALAKFEGIQASDSILIYIIDTITPGIKPVPAFSVLPETGTIDTIFVFDASQSRDTSTAFEDLLFRFDFEGDGEWDTDFSHTFRYEFKYNQVGSYQAVLEVMDTDGLIADTTVVVPIQHSGGPDPCNGYYSVPYGGKIYHTLRIGEQCWLRENLDVGSMVMAGEEQGDNEVIEKYCYDNDTLNCEKYGGLYLWTEAMNHMITLPGARGICPIGYHIPSDTDWKQLEGYVDSQYGPGASVWDAFGFRGFDAGIRMKAMLDWVSGGNGNNLSGFKALPGGYYSVSGFEGAGYSTEFWSASYSGPEMPITRGLSFEQDAISRSIRDTEYAFPVRCIRD